MEDDKKPKNQKGKINIELDEAVAEGIYSNLAIINHSVSEFVVDFVNIMPGRPKSKVKSRIILTPQHAKRLLKALGTYLFQVFEKENYIFQDSINTATEMLMQLSELLGENSIASQLRVVQKHISHR